MAQPLAGRILDLDDRPIAGATVTLRPVEPAGEALRPTTTNDQGRWILGPVTVGRWEVTVKATDFRTSRGWVTMTPHGLSPLTVWMRPLAEVTPFVAEKPGSVTGFIEMGNDLLEQGHSTRARLEYEKAIAQLPPESHPEILRSVARTHYLEGDLEKTIRALALALRSRSLPGQ